MAQCVKKINSKKRHCWVCSEDYWPKQCPNAERICYTEEQCCRGIIDVSFTIEEWLFFRRVVDYAMLERAEKI